MTTTDEGNPEGKLYCIEQDEVLEFYARDHSWCEPTYLFPTRQIAQVVLLTRLQREYNRITKRAEEIEKVCKEIHEELV